MGRWGWGGVGLALGWVVWLYVKGKCSYSILNVVIPIPEWLFSIIPQNLYNLIVKFMQDILLGIFCKDSEH